MNDAVVMTNFSSRLFRKSFSRYLWLKSSFKIYIPPCCNILLDSFIILRLNKLQTSLKSSASLVSTCMCERLSINVLGNVTWRKWLASILISIFWFGKII